MRSAILDTGPLVAYFCPRDEYHDWARSAFAQLPPGVFICEAVITEACHLAAKAGVSRARVLEFVERGRLNVVSLGSEMPAIRDLLTRYADAPMDFADGCVVRLAELHSAASVCTVDRDFSFYRKHGREVLTLIAPFG